MKNLQRVGSFSAFAMASAYLLGIALVFTVLDTSGLADPVEVVRFHVDHYVVFYIWISLIYIAAGVFLVPLALSINERLVASDPEIRPMAQMAAVFGLIWATLVLGSGLLHNTGLLETVRLFSEDAAEAALFWRVIETVHTGIGASIEIPGGIWTLLVGILALRTGTFSRTLNWIAVAAGTAGILSIVPFIADVVGPLYALGQIVWWVWMGILLRKPMEEIE